jgi:hypothetical protein
MRVLITGGTGDIGTAVCKRLLKKGWDIHIIDQKEKSSLPEVSYAQCDIMDFEALKKQMQGCDAIAHLAAIRSPNIAPNQAVFRVNVAGTFNVYEAAAQAGIKRVVQASSINAIGCAWSIGEIYPQYFPLDETHPRTPTDAYSFSKQMAEDIAEYFYRREGISGTSLRFPWVYNREKHIDENSFEDIKSTRGALQDLLELPPEARQARLETLQREVTAYRKTRPLEYLQQHGTSPFDLEHEDPLWHVYAFQRFDFWGSLDDRDAAQALEKSVTTSYSGSHPLFITSSQNSLGFNSKILAELFFPTVTTFKSELNDDESLFSNSRARDLIGFEAEYGLF